MVDQMIDLPRQTHVQSRWMDWDSDLERAARIDRVTRGEDPAGPWPHRAVSRSGKGLKIAGCESTLTHPRESFPPRTVVVS
jgi:hypothetical protein